MPIGKRNVSAIVVANVGSLPPQYQRVALVNYSGGTPPDYIGRSAVTVFSLRSTNVPAGCHIVGALWYTGPSASTAPVNTRKIAY